MADVADSTWLGPDPRDCEVEAPQVAGFRDMLAVLRPYRASLLSAWAFGLFATGAAALQPLVVAAVVDGSGEGLPTGLGLALGALLLLSGILGAVRQFILQRAGERFAFDTRSRLVRHLYSLPMTQLERRERGDLVSRVSGDVTQTRDILTSGIVDLAGGAVTVLVALVAMAVIDPILLGLSVAVVAVIIVSLAFIAARTGRAGLRHQAAIGELAASVSRALGSIKTIRATRSTDLEGDASVDSARNAMEAGLSIAGLKAGVESFSGISLQVLLIVVIGTGGLRVATGALSAGELSAFIMYLLLMAAPLALVGAIASMLGEALGALSRIREIEALPVERDIEKPKAGPAPAPEGTCPRAFEFEDVHFSYSHGGPADDAPAALNGVSLTIEEGEMTAIVGPSGAGKSTVVALLERFYEPSAGRILFYGRDVQAMSRDRLRSHIAYVDQDSAALSGTVGQNLRLGAPGATEDKCATALVHVGLAADVAAGMRVLHQEVGELGTRLSGGERQRVAIARAYLADSPIFLLDEITSNLDSRNEAIVRRLILRPSIPRTVVVIAHRFSTVVDADKIILLDEGRVRATGTHHELLRESSLYRELVEHQLKPSMHVERHHVTGAL